MQFDYGTQKYAANVMGLLQAKHRLAKSSPKQSAQYGFSSRLVKRSPAKLFWQCVHVKHSRCHGSFFIPRLARSEANQIVGYYEINSTEKID
ncbi:hypothetical protein HUJ04_002857 [Dendroctonus ponderosae]|nr:hypothetical protein HUJ04_002857 [Dendroctonus ponderosae]